MKVNWGRSKALSGWIVAVILTISLVGVVTALNPSFQTVIQPGSQVVGPNYIIFTDGTNYFARNGKTGAIDYSVSTCDSILTTLIGAGNGATSGFTGLFFFKAMTCYVTSTHTIGSNSIIQGEGGSTIFKTGNAANLGQGIFFTGFSTKNITFRDFVLDGNSGQQTSGECIHVRRTTNVIFDNLVFQNCYDAGIFIYDSQINTTYDIRVTNSYFFHNGQYGVFCGENCAGFSVVGNKFFQNGWKNGVRTGDVAVYPSNPVNVNFTIANNIFEYWQGTDVNSASIYMYTVNSGGTISGNYIYYSSSQGMLFTFSGHISVANNVVKYSRISGIYIEGTHDSVVSSNAVSFSGFGHTICSPGPENCGNGITVGSLLNGPTRIFSDHTVVTNNVVKNSMSAGIIDDSPNNIISNNVVSNSTQLTQSSPSNSAGIVIEGYYITATNNIAFDDQTIKTQLYGISDILTTGFTCHYCIIENNDVRGNGNSGVKNLGINTIVRWNTGYKTESSGNISLSSNTTYSKSHGLVVTPALVVLSSSNTACGAIQWIATSTTITITVATSCTATIYWYAQTWNW